MSRNFPDGFLWGASTAAYQIEGAVAADGRGPSIWDKFSHLPGKIQDDDNGDVACDHYHRHAEDVALMRRLNLGAYRFSTSWSRILPTGRGAVNVKGLDFYDRLVDEVAAAGIEPWLCLYHWDLPQRLEDQGGWQNRDVAHWFADYANIMVRRLGDRVRHIATFNEPNVAAFKGYGDGEHAPGIRGRASALAAVHTMNLAHGLALQAMRQERTGLALGNIYNLHPVEPATDRTSDIEAAAMLDAMWNRAFPDPQIHGRYPEPLAEAFAPLVRDGDFDIIRQPLDYFAFNHYTRLRARRDPDHPFHVAEVPPPDGRPVTDMGWEIAPEAFLAQMKEVKERYGDLPIYITENGAAFPDRPDQNGRVRDERRIEYLRLYLGAILDAIEAGVPVRGYFVWSMLDNFEWALGFSKRFGLVYVDYGTQERHPKDSFDFYAAVAGSGTLDQR
jgi:beta-glucosidase